jgi:hypothetical protein
VPPVSRLKVGAGAVALPADIAAELRRIEQRGGYARSRLELADHASAGATAEGAPPLEDPAARVAQAPDRRPTHP